MEEISLLSVTSLSLYALITALLILYFFVSVEERWYVLGLGSIIFIVFSCNLFSSICIFFLLGVAYFVGLKISTLDEKQTGNAEKRKKILTVGIAIVLVGLFIYKENWLFFDLIGIIVENTTHNELSSAFLFEPIGISYFSLTIIAYMCDVYWGMIEREKNPFKLFTVCMFFPLLTSGPIIKYGEVADKILEGHKFEYRNICFGSQRIIWGLFKKIVISERLAILVDTIYGDYEQYAGFYILIAVFLFVLQLYTDFSGWIDIMLGIAELFGVELPENFDMPFLSRTIAEFWRKWHITMGRWLKEYMFYPMLRCKSWNELGKTCRNKFGKKLGKKISTWCALMITWILIGTWHGTGFNYIFGVGIYMGVIIIFSEMIEPFSKRIKSKLGIEDNSIIWTSFQRVRTFMLFAVGLSFFRAKDFADGILLWKALFKVFNPEIIWDGAILQLGLSKYNMIVLIGACIIMILAYIISYKQQKSIREIVASRNLIIRWCLYWAIIMIVLVFGVYGPEYDASSFIYGAF